MMKHIKIFIFAILITIGMAAHGQSIGFGVAFPQDDSNIDESNSKLLLNRLHGILNSSDITDDGSDFVIVPKISTLSEDIIEGGMKNIYQLDIELTLEVLQLSTQKTFGTTSIDLNGYGMRYKKAAIKDALGKIKKSDKQLNAFFQETKKKIIDYYEKNSASILSSASTAASNGDYEQAIAILTSFPTGIKGSEDAQKKLMEVYNKYQTHNCKQIILQAKSAISVKNYNAALSLLSSIDSDSSCSSEATSLISSINKEVRASEAQARADAQRREQMAHDDQVRREQMAYNLTKTRINAAKEVAKAYYQRTYPKYYILY
ncbi:MAG: hypothetical protein J1E38_03995 [Paramuribaculum sp.]|nr:hypothetical protein [Paramuribaculum sp.]